MHPVDGQVVLRHRMHQSVIYIERESLIVYLCSVKALLQQQWSTPASAHMQLHMEGWVVVPRSNAALPLWTAIDNLMRRYLNEFSSPVIIFIVITIFI